MYTAGLFMIFERLHCQTLLFKGILQTPNFGQRLGKTAIISSIEWI